MRIVDRYITISIFKIFVSAIFVFCFLYILIDMASNLDEIIDRKVPPMVLLEYYASFLPIIIIQTTTVACLIATLFAYSNLNHHNEIIVLRSSGLDFWQIAKPAIFFGLMVSAAVFWVNERFVPDAEAKSKQIRNENMILEVDSKRKKKAKIKNLTFYGLKSRLYFIDSFDPNTYKLEGVTIIGYDGQSIKEKIVALDGEWTGIAWNFKKCQISSYDNEDIKTPIKVRVYDEKLMDIKETPQDFLKQRLNVTSMNIRQLDEYIAKFEHSGATKAINNLRVDLHQKYAFPVGSIMVILVGLPFALMTGRRKAVTFTSLGIAVAIGFSYYVINAVGLALGKGGLMPPFFAAWLAPFLFGLLSFYLIRTKF